MLAPPPTAPSLALYAAIHGRKSASPPYYPLGFLLVQGVSTKNFSDKSSSLLQESQDFLRLKSAGINVDEKGKNDKCVEIGGEVSEQKIMPEQDIELG